MENVDLIEKKIAFEFLEDVDSTGFNNKTASGIIIQEQQKNQVDRPRWGRVLKCAHGVTEVAVSDFILVEPLGWTPAIELDETGSKKFWITTEDRIMAVGDAKPTLANI